MKKLNQRAHKVMDKLTAPLNGVGSATKYDAHDYASKKRGIMSVSVECINEVEAGKIYSVTHYYEQNGDLMSDPDMTFLKAVSTGDYFPLTFRQDNLGIDQDSVVWKDGKITGIRPKMQSDMTTFANQWLMNIKDQQNL